jgi:RHS repeat-associated protein
MCDNADGFTSVRGDAKTYYSAGSQLIAMRQFTSPTSSVLYFLHSDHLGSTSLTTDNSGNAVARQLYDAWGNVRASASSGTMPTDIGYTGQRLDNSTGLMYYRARYYAPGLGRFISADTIVPSPQNPQTFNRYSYVNNSPLNLIDPTGHRGCKIGRKSSTCPTGQPPKKKQPQQPLLPPQLANNSEYSDWYGGKYTGCFMCHAAVAENTTILTNEELADIYNNAIDTGRGPYTVVMVTAGGAMVIVAGGEVIVAAGTAACADGDCTNEIQAVDRFLHYVGPDKIQQSGEAMSGAFKDPRMSVFSQKLGVTAQDVLQHFSQGSGSGRVYAFDETVLRNLQGVTDIVKNLGTTGNPFLDARHFEVLNTGTRSMAKLLRDVAVLVLEGNP